MHSLYYILTGLILITLFQNCGSDFSSLNGSSSIPTQLTVAEKARGQLKKKCRQESKNSISCQCLEKQIYFNCSLETLNLVSNNSDNTSSETVVPLVGDTEVVDSNEVPQANESQSINQTINNQPVVESQSFEDQSAMSQDEEFNETAVTTETSNCSVHVSDSGDNSNSGSETAPLKDVYTAIKKINNSGSVCFLAGSYNQVKLQNIKAPKSKPLTLMAHPKAIGRVFIVGGDISRGIGIAVYTSENIFVKGFTIKNLQKGVSFYSVTGGGIYDNKIERVGLEGIHVGAYLNYGTRKFEGGASSNIEVINNSVNGTGYYIISGQRHKYGEGIYIGTGAVPGDTTHHILVRGNSVKDTSAEAIEVKPHTQYIDIIKNTVENVNLQYSAAITIAISNISAQNSHCRVIGNTVKGVSTRQYSVAGIVVGNGTTEVSGNIVSDVEGGRAIRVVKAFHNANARNVIIKNNTIYGGRIAINDGDSGYPGMTGIVESSGNIIKP